MLVMAIVDGTRPASRRVWTGLQPTKCGMSGLRPTHSTFHRASRCHAGYEVAVMVPVDAVRVGADRCALPRVSTLNRHPNKSNTPSARTGIPACPYKLIYLASIPATADTNTDERSATGQRQGEGARFRRDVGTGICRVGAVRTGERIDRDPFSIGDDCYTDIRR